MSARPKPLSGVRVLDLTRLLPGPMCTMHLADMGADVIKVEDTGAGDYGRTLGPMVGRNSGLYLAVNRNKRSLRLDLKHPAGRDVFLRLARSADAIVEGFRPGVVDRLGIGYQAIREINRRIVYCAITGYGQTGPLRDVAGHDLNYIGYAGVLDQIGEADGPPVIPNFQIGDLAGGALTASLGILAALFDAARSGEGRYVDVAMTDGVLAHAVLPLAAQVSGQEQPRGQDFLSGGLPCYAVYRTADDRYLAVAALERKFWDVLCDVLGRPDLKPLHALGGADGRRVRRELQEIFAGRSLNHWTDTFAHRDCCVTPALTLREALEHPQVRARGMVVEADHPEDGTVRQFAFPVKFSDFDFEITRPAPDLGEHTDQILAEFGYGEADISRLRRGGAIG